MSDLKTFIQNTGLTLTLQQSRSTDPKKPYICHCKLSLENRAYHYAIESKKPIKHTLTDSLGMLSDDVLDYLSCEVNSDLDEDNSEEAQKILLAIYSEIKSFFGEHFDDFWALGLNICA